MKEIIDLYYDINSIYLELFNMELNGNKDSDSFLFLVELLKDKIKLEKNLMDLIDKDDYDKIYEQLINQENPICIRLCDYIIIDSVININVNDEDDFIEEDREILSKLGELYNACSRNIFLMYLSFFQDELNDDKNMELREKLLNLKYYNSFTKHDMEKSLIDNNFSVSKDNYIDLYMYKDMLGLPDELCNEIILDCYLSTIKLALSQLLNIMDNEYGDEYRMSILINNKCMLRACLSLLSDHEYNKIKKDIVTVIKNLYNGNNTISFGIVNKMLSMRNGDQERVRKIYINFRKFD